MGHKKKKNGTEVSVWLAIGVLALIILLLLWLTVADVLGDTDVAAIIPIGQWY